MNIAFAHHLSLSYNGGGERWLIQVANELTNRGHDVKICALPFLLDGNRRIDPRNELLDSVKYEEKYHFNIKADIVYVTYAPLFGIFFDTGNASKIAGIHSHCYWQPYNRKYGIFPTVSKFVHSIIGNMELERFDAVHVVTDYYKIEHDNVYHIPNFVNGYQYRPCAPKYDKFTVGYANRNVWQKGYDIYQKIKELVKDADFVETGGIIPEDDMPSWFSKLHVVVNPARVNTFGIANIQPLFCGTPVVASDIDTHRALGVPLRFAVSPFGYTQEINKLREEFESGEYQKISEKCREVSAKYDKNLVIDRIENMLEKTV